ncbi:hypothetical protein [Microbacterium arborescens]|uniref:hypothetical protein n=1 Tax=Microbacterium arborescens TaxID=33883 RepID=UPI0025A25F27|nr:hypothetical protein [Microbacterium arborescens]WJM15868.1 hypothetical protein QUC20_00730 [Microbacterium arborescens]
MTTATSRRPLIVLSIVAGVLLVVAAVVVFLLTQRDSAPAAAPSSPAPTSATPAPTPTPTPTTTPTDAAPLAAEIVMAATGFTIVADDGSTLLEFRWRDEVGPAVAALTEAFGMEPGLGVYPGDGNHFPDYTIYDWAGFTLYDMVVAPGDKPRDEYGIPTRAAITANAVGGVALTPEFGLAIGMDLEAVRAAGPDEESEFRDGGLRFSFEIERTGRWPEEGSTDDLTYSVFVDSDPDTTHVTAIDYAPFSRL